MRFERLPDFIEQSGAGQPVREGYSAGIGSNDVLYYLLIALLLVGVYYVYTKWYNKQQDNQQHKGILSKLKDLPKTPAGMMDPPKSMYVPNFPQ